METWEKPSSRGHHRNPSFSSTLLDHIYRSIDDNSPPLEPTRKKKPLHEDLDTSPDKLVFHRRSIAADFERSRRTTTTAAAADSVFLRYSNSTSSDSSGLSSSESDSFYGRSKSSASPPQPKPIRTSAVSSGERPTTKQELGGFLRTKSKALKIYTDLKKAKQPISPGGRLATFLNSLFTNASTNPKKPKKNTTSISVLSETQSSSTTCSSASSFSRSCLSKTPSSSGKSKRSVRFCPVNVILDEDSSVYIPCGNDTKRYRQVMEEENRRVIEAAKDLIRTYQKNKDLLAVTTCHDVEDDDDDAASCASSDLFELENLSAIGIERYQEELPVYETTRLDNTNRAVATSLTV
ncbi:unnamed protein product [Brassica rapa subsp. trilocularis]